MRPSGQVTLPTNPNAVVFTASAAELFHGRDWPAICRFAAQGLVEFDGASGLGGVAGYSWRTRIDRKNNRIPQVLAAFIFDGPATSRHMKVLEDAMRHAAIGWSIAHIERVPEKLALAVMIRDGLLHHLWEGTAEQPVFKDLVFSKGNVLLRERAAADCVEADFLPGVRHVRAVQPTFEDHDADLERMRLVFAQHFAKRIVEADGRIRDEELVFLDSVFPRHLMRKLQVADAASADAWFQRSCSELPSRLGHHDKLAMVGLFFSASYSDGSLDAREMRVLREAGEALGLTRHEVARYLERFW